MARGGKTPSARPSASTMRQDQDQEMDPGPDMPLAEPIMTRVVNPAYARTVIELNQHKYNVPIAAENMANLTGNELAEAIREYRERQIRAQEEADQAEGSENSGDSRRSVFERLGGKGKEKSQKAQSKDKDNEVAKQRKLEELRERIRREEEEKLEQKIQKRLQLEEEKLLSRTQSKRTLKEISP